MSDQKSATESNATTRVPALTPPSSKSGAAITFISEDQISIRKGWNTRSGDLELSGTGDDCDFQTLCDSIEVNKQETPIDVVPGPKSGTFFLVAGERRLRAVRVLKKAGKHDGQVLATVRPYDAVDERARNIRENQDRLNVRPADVCWGLKDLVEQLGVAKRKMTQVQIAQLVGISQTLVSRHLKIGAKVQSKIVDDWRSCPVPISVDQMLGIAELPKNEQRPAYNKLVRTDVPETESQTTDRTISVHKRADKVGTLLGTLERLGVVAAVEVELFSDPTVQEVLGINIPKNATRDVHQAVLETMLAAYNKGLEEPPAPPPAIEGAATAG